MHSDHFESAITECKRFFPNHFLSAERASQKYGTNTLAVTRTILCAVLAKNNEDIIRILSIATQHSVAIYPISTGNNWGYGGGTPVVDYCIIVDLSLMNQIIDFDAELGLVTVEPGVTQGQLASFLLEKKLPFMVPVTGAGPTCSLLGNVLERGYGINPHADHFGAMMSLKALLANGEVYQSTMAELGATQIDNAYKWGIGPYLDGLFIQANMGVVTQMTIALAPQPEYVEMMMFSLSSDTQLIDFFDRLRQILDSVGMNLGTVKLTNQHRIIASQKIFPHTKSSNNLLSIDSELDEQLRQINVQPWLGSCALYGNKKIIGAVRSTIKQHLKKQVKQLVFVKESSLRYGISLLPWLPIGKKKYHLVSLASKLLGYIQMMKGSPNQFALDLAYFKSGSIPLSDEIYNPDQDGCGIIWYTPLIPMISQHVGPFVSAAKQMMIEHHIEPVITFSSLSNRCIDCAFPILFDKNNPEALQNAHECYLALFNLGKSHGFLPYRMPAPFMHLMIDKNDSYWKLAKSIKNVIDPHSIISPGRYSLI